MTPTFELDEGNVSTFAKFEYEHGSSKTEQVFEKTKIISHYLFTSELEVKFMLKCYYLGGKCLHLVTS